MKKIFSLLMVLVITFAAAPAALAQIPAPGGPFNTWFRVQNEAATTAQCSYAFYNSSGVAQLTSAVIGVPTEDNLYVYVPSLALGAGQYSAVVSCDKPAAATVNFSDTDSEAAHSGITTPAPIWYAPSIMDNYWSYYSNVVVQNAHTGTVNITLEIYAAGSLTPVWTNTQNNVPKNGYVTWSQSGLPELADNVVYGAKIIGTGNVAPIVNIYGSGVTTGQLYSYNPFPSGTLKYYSPVAYRNYWGWYTAFDVQNIGGSAANIKVTYSNGTIRTYNGLEPNAAWEFYGGSNTYGLPDTIPANTAYAATIESTNGQPIIVQVNYANNYNRAASFSAFTGGAVKSFAPVVTKKYNQYISAIVCQNLGAVATTVTIKFIGPGTTYTSPSLIQGASYMFYTGSGIYDPLLSDGWVGSATMTSNASQPIVCVVNQNQDLLPEATIVMDKLSSYNGQSQ